MSRIQSLDSHWVRRCIGSGRCVRHALSQASPSGDGRCGRHKLGVWPFHILRDGGCDDGLLHDALGNAGAGRRLERCAPCRLLFASRRRRGDPGEEGGLCRVVLLLST